MSLSYTRRQSCFNTITICSFRSTTLLESVKPAIINYDCLSLHEIYPSTKLTLPQYQALFLDCPG